MKRYTANILATCCVPWDQEFGFLEKVFRDQVRYLLKHGTEHLYIFGTAGEGYAVNDRQFIKIAEVFHEECNEYGADPMVGIINTSLATVIERIRHARQMGVRYFQISLPNWGACNFREIRRFFAETCGRFEDCYFLHYNNSRSGRLVTGEEYAILADEFSNFVATKNSIDSLSQVLSLLNATTSLQHFFTESGFVLARLLGLEAGFLVSVASINWDTARLFYQACMERNLEQMADYAAELNDINENLFRIVGDQGHIDGVYDKIFARIADERFPLRMLKPYGYAAEQTYDCFVEFLREKYPNWSM